MRQSGMSTGRRRERRPFPDRRAGAGLDDPDPMSARSAPPGPASGRAERPGPDASRDSQEPDWHALDSVEVEARLGSRPTGLAGAEATLRLARHGPNRLAPPRRRGPLRRLLRQFHNLLIYVMLAAS